MPPAVGRCLVFFLILSFAPAGRSGPECEDDLDCWIGQMLMVGFRGLELPPQDPFRRQLHRLQLGGVVLFDYDVPSRSQRRNIASPDQVKQLVKSLQTAVIRPLFVAIDQEGGRISRLKPRNGFPESKSQAELGRLDDEGETRGQARATAHLLIDLGINLNLAPVVDLAVYPDNPIISRFERSYSAIPGQVVKHARWTLEEFQKAGLLAAIKHFPGHGSSREDSHLGLPDVSSHWSESEIEPFGRLVALGLPDIVMTAHLFNRHWDPLLPATLSERVIEGTLRRDLGFEGVVVSDDLQMGALAANFTLEKTIELAVKAGVDILVFSNNSPHGYQPEIADKAFQALKRLVADGTISRERVHRSYQRIHRLKNGL